MVQPSATGLPSNIAVEPTGISNVDLSSILLVDPDSGTISVLLNMPESGPFTFLSPGSGVDLNVVTNRLGQFTVSLQGPPGGVSSYFDTLTNIRVEDDPTPDLPDAIPQIQIILDDGSGLVDAGSIPFDVLTPVNAPPTVTGLPDRVTLTEDTVSPVSLGDALFADIDSPSITVTFRFSWRGMNFEGQDVSDPPSGLFVGAGVVPARVDTQTLTLVGAPGDINAYLDMFPLSVLPPSNVTGTSKGSLEVTITDEANRVFTNDTEIDITPVNDPPTGDLGIGNYFVVEGQEQTLDLSPVRVEDIDSSPITVTIELDGSDTTFLAPPNGAAQQVTATRVSPTKITVTGDPGSINAYLDNGLPVTTPFITRRIDPLQLDVSTIDNGSLRVTVDDGIATPVTLDLGSLFARFRNQPPTIENLPASTNGVEDIELPLNFQSVVIKDRENPEVTVTLTASGGSFGTPGTLDGVTATRVSGTVVTLTGTPEKLTEYLTSLVGNLPFRPPANVNGDGAVTIGLSAEDGFDLSDFGSLAVNVVPANDAPTDVVLTGTRVDEGAAQGTVVGSLTVIDPDAGDTHRLALLDDAMGLFALNGTSIVVNGTLDHEAAATHTINVQATDAGGLTFEKSITIAVGNVNEAPFAIPRTLFALENFPINSVVTATDPDGDALTFALGTGASNGTATVAADGAVRYAPNADFTGTDSFSFIVQDGDGALDTQSVSVTVEPREVAIPPSEALVLPVEQLDGRSVTGLSSGGTIQLSPGASFTFQDVVIDSSAGTVSVPGASFIVDADLTETGVLVFPSAARGLNLGFVDVLKGDGEDLSEGRAVDASAVNGIAPKGFLSSFTAGQFEVTLDKSQGDFDNALGAYIRNADGSVTDVKILFSSTGSAQEGAKQTVDVAAGGTLEFFAIQNFGALGQTLSEALSMDFSSARPQLKDGGEALDAEIFHSESTAFNSDGTEHFLSGVVQGGGALRVGLEDQIGGGDRDFQDVVFTVSALGDIA